MGREKDREIAWQLLSQAKQTWLGENEFSLLLIKIDLDNEKIKPSIKTTPFLTPLKLSSNLFTTNSCTPPKHHRIGYWVCSFSWSLLPSHAFTLPQCGLSMSHSSFRKYPSALVWDPPRAADNICSNAWSTFPPPSLTGVPSTVSHSVRSLLLSLAGVFCPFLNMFVQRCHAHG